MTNEILVEAVNLDTEQLLIRREDGMSGMVKATGWLCHGHMTNSPALADVVVFEVDGRRYDCSLARLGPEVRFQ